MAGEDKPVRLFKALMHPARLEILDVLRDGEQCVCHIEAMLGLRQAYISQQLSVLRDVGLVQDRRDGWNIYYRVADRQVYAIIDAARRMTGAPMTGSGRSLPAQTDARGQATGPASGKSAACPCPRCNPVESRPSGSGRSLTEPASTLV